MLNFSPEKLLVIGVLALVVLGPNRLPAAARSAGRMVAQLRRMSGSLPSEVRDALAEPRQLLRHAADELGVDQLRSSIKGDLAVAAPAAAPPAVAPAPAATSPAVVPADPPAPDDPTLN